MENLFLTVLDMSVTASYVILAILAVRLLLKRAPKKYSYALWAVAGFRLVCPVSFQSVLSLFNLDLFDTVSTTGNDPVSIPGDIGLAATPQINVGISSLNTVVNEQLPAATPTASINPMQIWILVGTVLWLAGIAIMVIVSIINYLRLRHGLRFATRMDKGIWQCETVRSPFILGIFRPWIYLPYGLDDQTRDYILAHEKHHLKRLDHVVKLLSFAILAVHWFNPLCYLAFYLMNRDMEMSCDEYVLSRAGVSSTDYSQTLLSIASNKRFPTPSPLAFGETGVKQRIKNILNWKKPALWVTIVALVLTVALLICCAADPQQAAANDVFGKTYVTVETISEPALYNGSTYDKSFYFDIAKDGTFSWVQSGTPKEYYKLKEVRLTEENFDAYLGPTTGSELRQSNKSAWGWQEAGSLCYILQQKNGEIYLVGGNIDPASAMLSWIFAFRLKESLSLPFTEYETQATVYESPLYPTSMVGSSLEFSISTDGTLTQKVGHSNIFIGALAPAEPLKGNRSFDTLFDAAGWKEDISAGILRRNNSAVWVCTKRVNMVSTDVYALLQQKDGSLYLLCGVYKEKEPMFRLYRLQLPTADDPSDSSHIVAGSGNRGTIHWTYDPDGSNATDQCFPIAFNMPYAYIEATCTFGNLMDLDSSSSGAIIPYGHTVTFPAQHTLYWCPPTGSASGSISFKIYSEDILLYYGTLILSGTAENGSNRKVEYAVTLQEGVNLALFGNAQDDATIYCTTQVRPNNNVDAFISQVLMEHYPQHPSPGSMGAYSHQIHFTGATSSGDESTVYYSAVAMYRQFTRSNGGISATKTDIFPLYIIAHQDADGVLTLVDCGFSNDDIPADEWGNAPTLLRSFDSLAESASLRLTQQCYAGAAPWIYDADTIIEDLLNQICSSPAQYSGPGSYIEAHREEYNTLLYYGEYTLSYCFRQFSQGGGAGLSGHIMALACQEAMAALGEDFSCQFGNGAEWFNQFKAHALLLRDAGVDLSLYPASYLLLSILPQPID